MKTEKLGAVCTHGSLYKIIKEQVHRINKGELCEKVT